MRLTSTLLSNAISFAKSVPEMAGKLQGRDEDDNLYLREILCRMETYTNNRDRFYLRVIFNYSTFNVANRDRPDVYIDLTTHADGSFRVLADPLTFQEEPNQDTTFK